MTLIITKRSDDYHAQLAGRPELWGCGRSPQEPIGDWVLTHGRDMGIKVEQPSADKTKGGE